ncbi:MAG: hypothetical protein K2L72_05910, partial [Clostridia bacterium]|nr:hypothetical protein [Clostridia bacterium]
MFILGIILAAIILLGAFVGTVAAYLAYCAKRPSHKFIAEIVVVGLVLIASLIIRMAVGFASLPDKTFADGFTSFFHGVFTAAAGLTFNSLLELGEITGGVLSCLYYG